MYAFIKTREASSKKKVKVQSRSDANEILTGTISRCLKDQGKSLVNVQAEKETFWLVYDDELPGKSEKIRYSLGKRFDAYESKELQMAIESVYQIRSLELPGDRD